MMPSRRDLLRQMAAVACTPLLTRAQPSPPNILFILIDDMGWRDLGCYGSTFYETPNIDRFAAQSMRFTNAYAACPVCSPTRASILTGKYPARLHLTDYIPGRAQWPTSRLLKAPFLDHLPLEETTIARALKPLGYASASIGKWHLGGPPYYPDKQGFDLNVGGTERGQPQSYFGPFQLPNLEGGSPDEYLTDRLTVEATRFIERNRNRPFLLYLPEFAVHLPKQAKPALVERFRAKRDPRNSQHDPVYAAMIASLDENVWRILKKLDDEGLADRTVVVFMSDNGGLAFEGGGKEPVTSNAPLRAGKGHLYEGGVREPMMIRWPGVTKAGSVCDVPVSSIDFFPTLLEIAGARVDPAWLVDGVSLTPLLRQAGTPRRDALFWHYPHYSNQGGVPGGAVRAGDYKLIEFYEDGRLELYNLAADIWESEDLSRKEPGRTAQLRGMLQKWRESVHATMPLPNPNYDPKKADQGLTGANPAPAKRP
ncbi:Sulfatase [Candidatus Sulfopaludibacter sp. SbA3]|nr:Sulfatase [Candidatus Sulfopaludibacter sp. SbA3]